MAGMVLLPCAQHANAVPDQGTAHANGEHKMHQHNTYTLAEIASFPHVAAGSVDLSRTWLDRQIEAGRNRMTTQLVVVTPSLADAILERNHHNRTLRQGAVQDFVQKLRDGRWLVVSQGISFSTDGLLNNGQHRCHAISQSGIAAPMNITFGEAREAFAVLDTQQRRGAAATLEVLGESYGSQLGAALRAIMNIERGGRGNYLIDNDQLAPLLAAHPRIRDSLAPGTRAAQRLKFSAAGAVTGHYLIATRSIKAGLLDKFWEPLVTGAGLAHPRDAILVLRDSLQKRTLYTKKVNPAHLVAAGIVNAWNLWSRDKRTVSVKWPDGTPFPDVL